MSSGTSTSGDRRHLYLLALVVALGVASIVAAIFAVDAAAGPTLGLYADPDGSSCRIEQLGPGVGMFYVLCELGGVVADGIRVAEFGVEGIPVDWAASVVLAPRVQTMLFDPLTGGAVVIFPQCEAGTNGWVLLCSIVYYAPGEAIAASELNLTRNQNRIDPSFQCPLVKVCEDVPETRVCVPGIGAVINGSACPVAVEPTTWSSLKKLFD